MITAVNTTNDTFWNRLDQFSDKRTKGRFLVDSPTDVALVIVAYLIMVWCGPKLMEKRRPFRIKGILIAYNMFLVLLNAFAIKDILLGTSRLGYNFFCHRSTGTYHPEELRITNAMWLFYMSKWLEFGDTLFFILRKKTSQLSGLHIYHHCTMLTYTWTATKWYPDDASVHLPVINGFIHMIMYSYYGLSALGPKVQKYLWWKKYLTLMQLVQFVISLAWSVNSIKTGCNHHVLIDIWNILYMCSFLYLFGKFYLRNYIKKSE